MCFFSQSWEWQWFEHKEGRINCFDAAVDAHAAALLPSSLKNRPSTLRERGVIDVLVKLRVIIFFKLLLQDIDVQNVDVEHGRFGFILTNGQGL